MPATGGNGGLDIEETVSGLVAGSRAGAVALHRVQYAGDEEDVTVAMTFSPADPSFREAFGFKIYDPQGNVEATGDRTDTLGMRKATFASDVAGEYTVQIYNYASGVNLNYAIEVTR